MPTRKKQKTPSARRVSAARKRNTDLVTTLSQAADKRMTLADLRKAGFHLPTPSKKLRQRAREIFERARSLAQGRPVRAKSSARSRARRHTRSSARKRVA